MNLLMADDDRDDYDIICEAGGRYPHLVVTYAANWIELWQRLQKEIPDLLVLDINMPVKDGLECLQTLRSDAKFDALPIIMYSVSLHKSHIDMAYAYKANYYAVKPLNFEGVIKLVEHITGMDKEALRTQPSRESFIITT